MTRVAVEIARTLPSLAERTDLDRLLSDLMLIMRDPFLSRGEKYALRFAYEAEQFLFNCDAETVDAALEVVDRLRAGMRVPADQPTLAELWADHAARRGEVA